jgi:N6-adenosine-specific RNA methylase IME4
MSVTDIFELLDRDIFANADPTHTVFMWMVDEFLVQAEAEMERRGYRRHARLVWNKMNGVAPAFTVRYSHEYLVWFYKPKMLPVDQATRGVFTTVFEERSRQHSRKPEAAYDMVNRLYPEARKMDVFSRERREGWEQYGNQLEHFA